MTADLMRWADAGFASELIAVCGPNDTCSSPGKRPHLPGWQEAVVTPEMLATWSRTHIGNIGLRTRYFPAVDLDVEDPCVADTCEDIITMTVGATACRIRASTACRVLLFRLDGPPFHKSTIRLELPGSEPARVEILAAGQQVVVGGVHRTGAPIEWRPALPTAGELTTMSSSQRDQVLAALRSRLARLGSTVEGPLTPEPRARKAGRSRTGLDAEIAELALSRLDPDSSYEDWLRVGMALHCRWSDETGFALWDAWSSRGEKYPGTRELGRHWASFHADGGVGFGTLIAMARRARR